MAQVSVIVHRGMAQMEFSAAQTKLWAGSPLRLPGNTVLLPALQMRQAFSADPDQAQQGNYEACPKKKNKITAFCKQAEKWGREKEEEALLFQSPLQCACTYYLDMIIKFNSQIKRMSKNYPKTFSIK